MTDTHVRSVWQRLGDAVETAILSAVVAGGVGVAIAAALGAALTPGLGGRDPLELIWIFFIPPAIVVIAAISGAVMGAARPRRFTRWPLLVGAILAIGLIADVAILISSGTTDFLHDLVDWRSLAPVFGLPAVGILSAAGVHLILTRRSPRAARVSRIILAVVAVAVIIPVAMWATRSYSSGARYITGVAIGPNGRIYASTSSGLFAADREALRWHRLPCTPLWRGYVGAVGADLRHPGLVVADAVESVRRSDDGGRTWRPVKELMFGGTFASTPHGLYAAGQGALMHINANGKWVRRPARKSDDGPPAATCFAVSPRNANLIVVGSKYSYADSGLRLTRDGGRKRESVRLPATGGAHGVAIIPGPRETMVAAVAGAIYRSSDAGRTWSTVGAPAGGWSISDTVAMAVASTRTPVIYLAADYKLFASSDLGRTWRDTGMALGIGEGRWATYVATDLQRPRDVYAGTNDGLYRSRDGGTTWRRIK